MQLHVIYVHLCSCTKMHKHALEAVSTPNSQLITSCLFKPTTCSYLVHALQQLDIEANQ